MEAFRRLFQNHDLYNSIMSQMGDMMYANFRAQDEAVFNPERFKEKVLGVPADTIERFGVVSSEVAAAMAEGVRRLTGSDYAVATTGLAGPGGDGLNPEGTVWIAASGPHGTRTQKYVYKNDRKRNIERFSATALDFLRQMLLSDLSN